MKSGMKSAIFALLGTSMFALHNVVVEQKLARFGTLSLMAYFYVSVVPIVFCIIGWMKFTNQPINPPIGKEAIALAILCGVIYFVADFFYVGAYTSGGDLATITTIVTLFPVIASAMKFVWVRQLPNKYHIAGYLLTVLAVYLITKGNMVRQ